MEFTASNIAKSTIVTSRSPRAAGDATADAFASQSVMTSAEHGARAKHAPMSASVIVGHRIGRNIEDLRVFITVSLVKPVVWNSSIGPRRILFHASSCPQVHFLYWR
jgi:hypothetical protein